MLMKAYWNILVSMKVTWSTRVNEIIFEILNLKNFKIIAWNSVLFFQCIYVFSKNGIKYEYRNMNFF